MTTYRIPGLIVVLLGSYTFYLTRNFLLVGAILGISVLGFVVQGFFQRLRPTDRFHILQPWKIPNPATPVTLWLLAGFDALLHSPFYIAIVLTLAFIADLGALYVGLMFPSLLVITLLRRYRHMRRQYEPVPDRDDERGRRSSLPYVGPSPLSRREKTTTATGATAVFIVGFIVAPLLVVLWHSRG